MSALREQLEEKEEIRMAWEKRRKQIEHETTKLQQLHKIQIERLRKRLVNAKMEEERLEGELDQAVTEKEKTAENLWQLEREKTNVREQRKCEGKLC